MANISASVSWGSSSSSSVGLDSSLWGAMSTTPTSTNSSWGSSTNSSSLSLSQGHNVQIGASSVVDNQNSNGSASASSWGMSSICQNGAAVPGNLTPSQSGSLASSNIASQSGSSLASSQGVGTLGTGAMSWQNSKSFGMRDFTPTSDSSWSNPSSTAVSSSNNNSGKETNSSVASSLSEPGKMDLAAGLANLAIDKTAPPPDMNWNAMKSGWNNTVDSSKLPVGPVSNPELSFAQATQKGRKSVIDVFMDTVLSPKEEEIRRAIYSNEGWGTRPIRQDTSWDIDSLPKTSRKVSMESSEMAASNVWNNNNGTAIWESTRETQAQGWGGGAAAGGNVFAEKDPNAWNMPPKSSMEGSSWGGGTNNPMGNNPASDKSIGTWGGESQQSSSKLWGSKTETGSWNEPPPERSNMTWGGQETDVGTWEDPTSTSRRIVSSSGVGNVGLGGNTNAMNMNGSNISGGGSNFSMGSSNMSIGGCSMGMGSGSGMGNNMMMPMAGSGGGPVGSSGIGGSNMGMGGSNNMNMLMGSGNSMNIGGGGMGIGSGNDSMYWNDPNSKPQGWNPAAGPPRPKPDEVWNKSGTGRPIGNNGWGEPNNGNSQKADDGTSIWAANAQEQARAAGWGEPGAVWNPAFGARPKSTCWAGGDQDNWQRKLGQQRFPGNGGQPQMRIKLIQQLMDMGFKKEEAQNALISNNMNFESALEELHKKELENDVFQASGSKMQRQGFMSDNSGMIGEDVLENRADCNPHVPNFPMQNTPFSNSQVPSQPFMSGGINMYDRSKAGLPMPPNNSGNMNNLQHKFKVLQQQGAAGPAMKSLSPTQVRGGPLPGSNTQTMVQQQAAQQQILQQLQLAVQSGLISPQLLNHQLPHNILVMLQQLLQLQNAMQNMLQRQQFLQQNKVALNIPRPQLEQVSVMVGQYKSQIQVLQKQLQVAQQTLLMKQQPPSAPTPTPQSVQSITQLPIGMPPPIAASVQAEGSESVSLSGDITTINTGANNSGMPRLNQWKQISPERDNQADLNKAPGSKPQQGLQHSHSTPTLGPFGDLMSLNITGDTTWSSTATSGASNWPSTSGDLNSHDGKTDDSSTAAAGLSEGGNLGLSDVIPEFVPGKPWQGLSNKSVEDDPHITPGSISRSLSVNVVKDDYLNHLAGNKSSPSLNTDSTWSMGKLGNPSVDSSMVNAMAFGNTQNHLSNSQVGSNGQWFGAGGYSRQNSWAGRSAGSAFTQVSGSGWENRQSSSWLKNISSQVEEQ